MSIFDSNPKKFDSYRNNSIVISRTLDNGNFHILSKNEFSDWYFSLKRLRSETTKGIEKSSQSLFKILTSNVCQKGIDDYYLKSSVSNAIEKTVYSEQKFDLLVVMKKNYDRYKNHNSNKKMNFVEAFMITELGECKRKPNTISINLICVRDKSKIKAYHLIGPLLYCLKDNKNFKQEVVLELADKYTNLKGFKSYTRIGFDRNKELYGTDCFDDIRNLPMSLNLEEYSTDDIINFSSRISERTNIDDETGLARSSIPKNEEEEEKQKQIIETANYIHELEVGVEPNTENYKYIIGESSTESQKKKKLKEHIEEIVKKKGGRRKVYSKKKKKIRRKKTRKKYNS